MVYNKALLFNDMETASKILQAKKPAEHKALGREIRNFDESRWCFFCEGIVYTGNYHKFSQNPALKQTLLDRQNWRGLNLLGLALTRVRETLRWEENVAST